MKKLLAYGGLFLLVVFFNACQKETPILETTNSGDKGLSTTTQQSGQAILFFDPNFLSNNHPHLKAAVDNRTDIDPFVAEVRDYLIAQNAQENIVDDIIELAGYPAWDRSIADLLSSNESIALVPYIKMEDESVQTILVAYRRDGLMNVKFWNRSFLSNFNIPADNVMHGVWSNCLSYFDALDEELFTGSSSNINTDDQSTVNNSVSSRNSIHYFINDNGICIKRVELSTYSYEIGVPMQECNDHIGNPGGSTSTPSSGRKFDFSVFGNWWQHTFFPTPNSGGGTSNNNPNNSTVNWNFVNDLRLDLAQSELAAYVQRLLNCQNTEASTQERFQYLVSALSSHLQGNIPGLELNLGDLSSALESFSNEQYMSAGAAVVEAVLAASNTTDYDAILNSMVDLFSTFSPCPSGSSSEGDGILEVLCQDAAIAFISSHGLNMSPADLQALIGTPSSCSNQAAFDEFALQKLFNDLNTKLDLDDNMACLMSAQGTDQLVNIANFYNAHHGDQADDCEENLSTAICNAFADTYCEEGITTLNLGEVGNSADPIWTIMKEQLWEMLKELTADFIPGGTLVLLGPELFNNLQSGDWMNAMYNAVDIVLNEADVCFPIAKVASFGAGLFVTAKQLAEFYEAFKKIKLFGDQVVSKLYHVLSTKLDDIYKNFKWVNNRVGVELKNAGDPLEFWDELEALFPDADVLSPSELAPYELAGIKINGGQVRISIKFGGNNNPDGYTLEFKYHTGYTFKVRFK
ncbi:MAG: hypothetical protein AAGG75_22290 [Bacteroidota bacterium]